MSTRGVATSGRVAYEVLRSFIVSSGQVCTGTTMTSGRTPPFRRGAAPLGSSRALVVHHPAVAQLDDARAVRRIHLRVRHLNDRRPTFVQCPKQLHDLFALSRVKVTGGLVREDHL